jgi:hypothetical protein
MLQKGGKMSELYRVVWRCVSTGMKGHGDYTTYAEAKEWADHGNRKWGTDPWLRREAWRLELDGNDDGLIISHWLENKKETKQG